MGTMQEPIYTIEIHDIDETLKLLMFKGSLMEWKSAFTDRRSYG
jgi:hypothetical protein